MFTRKCFARGIHELLLFERCKLEVNSFLSGKGRDDNKHQQYLRYRLFHLRRNSNSIDPLVKPRF